MYFPKQHLLLFLFFLCGWQVQAQELSQDFLPRYFPSKLMRAEAVMSVHMYEHIQLDSSAAAGHIIRIAKEKSESTLFNKQGDPISKEIFAPGQRARNITVCDYNEKGQITQKLYQHFTPANTFQTDSAWIPLIQAVTRYTYDGDRLKTQRSNSMPDDVLLQTTESSYYPDGRLQVERKTSDRRSLTRAYTYEGSSVLIEERSEKMLVRSERLELDKAGRVLTHAYIPVLQTHADLTETYTYDAQGLLEEVRYEFDWNKHDRADVLLSRKNRYDAQGKLTESSFDYGDGRQIIQWFDYEYWDDDK